MFWTDIKEVKLLRKSAFLFSSHIHYSANCNKYFKKEKVAKEKKELFKNNRMFLQVLYIPKHFFCLWIKNFPYSLHRFFYPLSYQVAVDINTEVLILSCLHDLSFPLLLSYWFVKVLQQCFLIFGMKKKKGILILKIIFYSKSWAYNIRNDLNTALTSYLVSCFSFI